MYLLKRLFMIIFISIIGLLILKQGYYFIKWLESAEPLELRANDETRSIVHWLDETSPLVYTYNPARVEQLRILSNAIFEQNTSSDSPINYAIDYQILDKNNQVVFEHRYHHASKLVDNNEASQVKQLIENRKALKVSSGQSFYVSKANLALGQTISLKVVPEHPLLKGVVIRVHAKVPELEQDLERAWLQLSDERKSRILSYHTLGEYAVSTDEIAQSVRYGWLKLAPQGVPKIDFKDDMLYEHLPYNVKTYDFDVEQFDLNALYTDSQLAASISIDKPTQFSINATTSAPLNVVWYDKTQHFAPKQILLNTLDEGVWQTPILEPGLLVISSTATQLTRWQDQSGQSFELLHNYYYELDSTTSARYPVTDNLAVRLEFRPTQSTTATIHYWQDNKLLETQQVPLQLVPSKFDRAITNQTMREPISESVYYYLRVPKGADRLEINSEQATWFKLSHRTEAGLAQSRLCSVACINRKFEQITSWFPLNASNDFDFVAHEKIKKVRLFQSPPAAINNEFFFESADLSRYATQSNTALVYSPWRYFESPPPPAPFRYRQWDGNQADLNTYPPKMMAQARVVQKHVQQTPYVVMLPVTDYIASKAKTNTETTYFLSLQPEPTWTETRLYQLPANQMVRIPLPAKEVARIYIKPFMDKSSKPFLLKTFVNVTKKNAITTDYTVTRHHAVLDASHGENTLDAFMLHPTQPKLVSFPSHALFLGNDIAHAHHLDLVSEKPLWVSITFALTKAPNKIQWRQTDDE